MPAYTLKIGERSFWIDARSDEGAIGLTVATFTDEMSGDKILLKTVLDERVVLRTTVEDMTGGLAPPGDSPPPID